ncbi:MAG: Bug family tripartite tricarboxylate transporter substrate binding protein [Comamonas sp.]
MQRRHFIQTGAAALLTTAFPMASFAQANTVKIVIPFTPGTTPDTMARVMSPVMQEKLGKAVIVENKPGASGLIGIRQVFNSNDPLSIQIISSTALAIPLFYKNAGFDIINEFVPITHVASSSFVLAVNSSVPASNLQEFIHWSKSNTSSYYASPGIGTHHHLFMELLLQKLDLQMEHAPYKGFGPALNDLMGGQVSAMFIPIQVAAAQKATGRIKIIGGSLRDRHPQFPDIPSLHEQGAQGFHADPWYAVWGSPKVSAQQAKEYRDACLDAFADPAVAKNFSDQGLIIKPSTPEELKAIAQREFQMWSEVVKKGNIRLE